MATSPLKVGKSDFGQELSADEVPEVFRRNLHGALKSPMFAVPKEFETWIIDRVAMSGLRVSVAQLVGSSQLPGHEYAHKEFTGYVTISATTEATATTIVTAPAVTFDGATAVLIEFYAMDFLSNAHASGNAVFLALYEDGASIGQIGVLSISANANLQVPVRVARKKTPSAGSHTYSIRGYRTNADGIAVAGSGGSGDEMPGFIRITRV